MKSTRNLLLGTLASLAAVIVAGAPATAQQKRPNIVMLMTDDTGWQDFGAYSGGGAALGHPTDEIHSFQTSLIVVSALIRALRQLDF